MKKRRGELVEIPGLKIYGTAKNKASVISFNVGENDIEYTGTLNNALNYFHIKYFARPVALFRASRIDSLSMPYSSGFDIKLLNTSSFVELLKKGSRAYGNIMGFVLKE